MSERFIPCIMKPSAACNPSCPSFKEAVELRDYYEKRFAQDTGRPATDEEIITAFAKIDPLIPVIHAPDKIANSCPQSTVRKVTIQPF